MIANQVYEVKPTRKPADFIRQILLKLGRDSFTPTDIFQKMQLNEKNVTIWYEYIFRCKTTGTIKYSMSVGYDRKETYTDIEEKYDSKIGTKVPVKVVKERTVTDWRPHSDTASGGEVFKSGLPSASGKILDKTWVRTFFDEVKESEYIPSDETREIPPNILKDAERSLKYEIFYKAKDIGDHQKDEKVELTSIEYQSLEVFKVPFMGVTYTYNGQEYSAIELACGSPYSHYMLCSSPGIDKANNPEKNAEKQVKKERMIAKYCKWGTWGLIAVFFALSVLMIPVPAIIPFITIVPCAGAAVAFKVIAENKYQQIFSENATTLRIAKLPHLEEALKTRNLAGLTESEKSSFQYHEIKKKSAKELIKQGFALNKTFIILTCVALVIVLGAFAIYGSAFASIE